MINIASFGSVSAPKIKTNLVLGVTDNLSLEVAIGRVGPKLARFFRAKILTTQSALKTGPVGQNSLFKAKKNSDGPGQAIPGGAKFGPIFFGPII